MSFYTSLTGLNGATKDISTISNNIANVGTTGFKRARAEFGDIFATSPLQNASSAVGSGTILKSIKQQFTQGNITSSLNALDLAISGQGFFALQPSLTSTQTVYTRNGSFSVNNDRYVVDSQGQYLQVFPVNDDGSVIATGLESATSLQLPTTSGLPQATTKIELGLNLPADAEVVPARASFTESNPWRFDRTNPDTYNKSTSITIYDSLGNPTIATIYYVKTSNATEASPSNKWQTYVYVGAEEIEPALITAKDDNSKTVYINKFGQITSDPQAADPTFNADAPHPLYKQDDQVNQEPSSPAKAVGAFMQAVGFDFGDTDSNRVNIVLDPGAFSTTREGGEKKANPDYFGGSLFSLSVDGSEPQVISVNPGAYTGTELAAEMTRAANEAFGDDRYIRIKDTFTSGSLDANSNVVSSLSVGNDIIKLDLFKLDPVSGGSVGLVKSNNGVTEENPIIIDLVGDAGSEGSAFVQTGSGSSATFASAPENDLQLTRDELIKLVQQKLNAALNKRNVEFGKTADWVDAASPPIIVGYDTFTRALTFTVDRTQLGPNSTELESRFNSLKVFGDASVTNNLGIPPVTTSPEVLIRAGSAWQGSGIVPEGDSILDPLDQRFGVSCKYNKDTRRFEFTSGSTGESSEIRVGRPTLAQSTSAQVTSFDLSDSTNVTNQLSAGQTVTLSFGGPEFHTFSYTATASLSGTALASALATGLKLVDPDTGTLASPAQSIADVFQRSGGDSFSIAAGSGNALGKLLLTGFGNGDKFSASLRIGGRVKAPEPVGATQSLSVKGVRLGDPVVTTGADAFAGNSDLLGIGDANYKDLVVTTLGTGLESLNAVATGNRAITPMNQTFVLQEALGENKMTFTIDGIVGEIALPIKAYTGETFAAEIEKRVNLIQDPATGKTVSGVKVKFDADNNRLIFTSGTEGESSQLNVVGHPNFGLRDVTQTRGSVPVITNLKQATDSEGNKLYVDKDGNISTQEPSSLQNWFPLYLDEGELTFDTFGKLISPKEGVIYSPFDPSNGSNLINLSIDYGKFSTQFAQPFSVLSLTQDGFASGRLDGLEIDASGTIRANYTNGQTSALGKVILANFANPNGLKQIGNANYVATSGSGEVQLGEAGADGFGTIQGGSLERSNVDITEELVDLITAQRNFQANAKAIETTTTLTQTIIQIRG